jgi:nicotinamide-nucleotide amidase
MPSVELIAVGTELLLGQLVDTNTPYVAAHLADAGIDVYATHTVGDNRERISAAIRASLGRADGVVTTGGLGPTVDDLTKEAVCDGLGLETVLHEPSLEWMQALFSKFGRAMTDNNRKQANMPRDARVLENPNGTAPGFIAFDDNGKFVACMPGVPREMKPMLEALIAFLRERFELRDAIWTRVIHTIAIGESDVDQRIGDLFSSLENPKIAVLAHEWRCDVKIMAKASSREAAEAAIAPVQAEIERRLAEHVFGCDEVTLDGAVHTLLRDRKLSIAVAESCTGGRIAAALTAAPGSSKSFVGGIVAYDNEIKIQELGVAQTLLNAHGAVSEEVVRAMAEGVRGRWHANLGLATTGIAGPDGGSYEKPVGLVWFALAGPVTSIAWRLEFPGDRAAVQSRATTAALGILWKYLLAGEPNQTPPA